LIKEWSKLSEYGNNNMYPKLNNISMKESLDLGLIDLWLFYINIDKLNNLYVYYNSFEKNILLINS